MRSRYSVSFERLVVNPWRISHYAYVTNGTFAARTRRNNKCAEAGVND